MVEKSGDLKKEFFCSIIYSDLVCDMVMYDCRLKGIRVIILCLDRIL